MEDHRTFFLYVTIFILCFFSFPRSHLDPVYIQCPSLSQADANEVSIKGVCVSSPSLGGTVLARAEGQAGSLPRHRLDLLLNRSSPKKLHQIAYTNKFQARHSDTYTNFVKFQVGLATSVASPASHAVICIIKNQMAHLQCVVDACAKA